MNAIPLRLRSPLSRCLALAAPAVAQTNPSADQIIKALKPSPQMLQGSPTRGIRPIAPSPGSDVAPVSTAPRLPATGASTSTKADTDHREDAGARRSIFTFRSKTAPPS